MKKTSKLSRLLRCFWLYDKEPNEEWDTLLNLLMDKAKVTDIGDYTITFDNKFTVWIANHPFASGSSYNSYSTERFHCTKATKIRLEDFVNDYLKKESSLAADIEFYKNKQ